jgi:hypothetical protein
VKRTFGIVCTLVWMLAVTGPVSLSLSASPVSVNTAMAAGIIPIGPGGGGPAPCSTNHGVLPNLWNGIGCDANGDPQITSASDALVILANAIQIGIALAGALAVIMIVVGGIQYTISAGDSKRVATAKSTLTYAIGGLVLCMAAYAIVQFISQGF